MPQLSDYIQVEFKQGAELRRQMRFDKAAHGGVCMSLVIEFLKQLEDGADPEDLNEILKDNLRLAAGRQKIFSSGWSDMGNKGRVSQTKLLTRLGDHTGIKAKLLAKGDSFDPVVTKVCANPEKHIYAYLKFPKGAHAIYVLYLADGEVLLMFDPNFGILGAEGDIDIKQMMSLLWAEYGSYGMPVKSWSLYSLVLKETVMQKWQRGAFK